MTKLTRTVSRETASMERGSPIVIELHPKHMLLRLKGERRGVCLAYDAARDLALKLEARRHGARV